MASKQDLTVASLAAGFTLGFGFLTVWEAIKQTTQNKSPLRSAYIYMIWGEILANLLIGIMGWLFLSGVVGPSVQVLFFILVLWVFEIQLLMQIIINRIAIIAENRSWITKLKWGTAAIITTINVAVFCIWIPAHTIPPVNHVFVEINKYWDRTSKILILIVDAGLNWYFLRAVKIRLVQNNGLVKYQPLVSFNTRIMILSIGMDVMLIGLMSLPNPVVYVQFHPVAYMVKLNIEMTMAKLIVRIARQPTNNAFSFQKSYDANYNGSHHARPTTSFVERGGDPRRKLEDGIRRCTDIEVHVHARSERKDEMDSVEIRENSRTTTMGTVNIGSGDDAFQFDIGDDMPLTEMGMIHNKAG